MDIELTEETVSALIEHASLSIAFDVDRIIDIEARGNDFVLSERRLDVSYRKDYHATALRSIQLGVDCGPLGQQARRRGCALERINRFVYPALPGVIQMIWYKDLLLAPA